MFDDLVETKRRRTKGVGRAGVVAVGVHLAAIPVALLVNLLATSPVEPPTIKVVFLSAQAPPPPPPPPAPRRRPKPKPEEAKPTPPPQVQAPTAIVQPVQVPDVLPEVIDDAPDDGLFDGPDFGIEGGVEGGAEGGVDGGVLGGMEGGVEGSVVSDEPMRVGGDVEAPEILSQVKPKYPEVAKAAKVSGIVILEAIINREGQVEEVKVLRGHPLLEQAAKEAVVKWKFRPGRLNGKPVPVIFTLTVNFTLR